MEVVVKRAGRRQEPGLKIGARGLGFYDLGTDTAGCKSSMHMVPIPNGCGRPLFGLSGDPFTSNLASVWFVFRFLVCLPSSNFLAWAPTCFRLTGSVCPNWFSTCCLSSNSEKPRRGVVE